MVMIKKHIEWVAFSVGLIALAFMNPEINSGISFCLFEWAGIDFCPGKGLGHSIAYTFRGEFANAFNAHYMGPFAVFILSLRILHIWSSLLNINTHKKSHND